MRSFLLLVPLCTLVTNTAFAEESEYVETYEQIMARARTAAHAGQFRRAARIVEPLLARYPQDYEVSLQLGWYSYLAGDYSDAERAYREALKRAPASVDARIGLAWTLVERVRCEEAIRALNDIEDDPRASEVVHVCSAGKLDVGEHATLGAAYVQSQFPGDPVKSSAKGVYGHASVRVHSDYALGASYRYLSVATHFIPSFEQHEIYAHAAYSSPFFGLGLHAAIVSDGSGATGTSRHGEFVGRLTAFGDVQLSASVSDYTDRTITRFSPSWTIPVVGPLRLQPNVAMQRTRGETLLSAGLTVLLDWRQLSLFASARYGLEERPVWLARSVVYDILDRIEWGAAAGAQFRFTNSRAGGFGVSAAYSYDRLHVESTATRAVQTLTVGPVVTF